jgi:hypothetical protein
MHQLCGETTALFGEVLIAICDVRKPGAAKRPRRDLRAWGKCACTEVLVDGRVALVIRPGGAKELTRRSAR